MIRQKQQQALGNRIAIAMIIGGGSLLFLYYCRPVLLPLAFATIAALLLYPLCRFFENNGFPRIIAILLTMFIVLCIVTGLILLVSSQIYRFTKDLPDLRDKLITFLTTWNGTCLRIITYRYLP